MAAFATAARGLMPSALRHLADEYPRLSVHLFEEDPSAALPRVARGDHDLAVVHDWPGSPLPSPDGMERAHLVDDQAEVVLPADHALAGRESVTLPELARARWIGPTSGGVCRAWLLDTMRQAGIEPEVVHRASEYPTQISLVAAGVGVALLPRLGRGILPPDVVAVPVRPRLVRHLYTVVRSESARRPAVQAVVTALRGVAGTVGGERY